MSDTSAQEKFPHVRPQAMSDEWGYDHSWVTTEDIREDPGTDMGCLRGCLLGFGMVVAALLLLFMVAGFIGWLS